MTFQTCDTCMFTLDCEAAQKCRDDAFSLTADQKFVLDAAVARPSESVEPMLELGKPCPKCGKTVTAPLSHMCPQPRPTEKDGESPERRLLREAFNAPDDVECRWYEEVEALLAQPEAAQSAIPAREQELASCLRELQAMVWGECPSLLNEDSGGNAELDCRIDAALSNGSAGKDEDVFHPFCHKCGQPAPSSGGCQRDYCGIRDVDGKAKP